MITCPRLRLSFSHASLHSGMRSESSLPHPPSCESPRGRRIIFHRLASQCDCFSPLFPASPTWQAAFRETCSCQWSMLIFHWPNLCLSLCISLVSLLRMLRRICIRPRIFFVPSDGRINFVSPYFPFSCSFEFSKWRATAALHTWPGSWMTVKHSCQIQ